VSVPNVSEIRDHDFQMRIQKHFRVSLRNVFTGRSHAAHRAFRPHPGKKGSGYSEKMLNTGEVERDLTLGHRDRLSAYSRIASYESLHVYWLFWRKPSPFGSLKTSRASLRAWISASRRLVFSSQLMPVSMHAGRRVSRAWRDISRSFWLSFSLFSVATRSPDAIFKSSFALSRPSSLEDSDALASLLYSAYCV